MKDGLYNGTLDIKRVVKSTCRTCRYSEYNFFHKDCPVEDIIHHLRHQGWIVSKHGLICPVCRATKEKDDIREVQE